MSDLQLDISTHCHYCVPFVVISTANGTQSWFRTTRGKRFATAVMSGGAAVFAVTRKAQTA
jgi:hypothetical protein